jgi:hypothetical protein
MGSVGLLYVGAVLFINGLMLIGVIPGKSAAILNFFVGAMQVIFPTLIILHANGNLSVIFAAAGLYLFGFTYLYVGILQVTGISGEGLGWFSLFVAACAIVIGILQFTLIGDPVFGAIWFVWAVLWFMFFLILGLNKVGLTRMTGWFTVFISHLTGTIPAFFLLVGRYETNTTYAALVAAVAAVSLVAAYILGRRAMRASASPGGEAAHVTHPA